MKKKFQSIRQVWLKNKLVLLRSDLNSDVKGKKILPSERIKESARTIEYLKRHEARIVILAHQGNPKKNDFLSLRQHAKQLNKYTKVKFIPDVLGKKAINAIKKVKSGDAILLDNVRFVKDEFNPKKKNNSLLKLAELFDLYVNDAFSVCHREHTSITGFPKLIESCVGLLVEKELDALKKVSMKECLYVLGGAKPETNIKLLRGNKILACGLFGQICLVSEGKDLGYQNKFLKKATLVKGGYNKFLEKLKSKQKNVETPVDFAVNFHEKRKEFDLEEFPLEYEIEDIGKKTIKNYVKEIKKAKGIYMKGPAGYVGDKKFEKGTVKILKTISKAKGFSLVGGGHLSDVIKRNKINKKKFNHVSLSGGALLNYIAGKKLVGLEALGYYR
ncbi:MAG: phosphoglycerate kinase [Candidatus Pacearchaeota archaeon]|nr:phosphoglycerate kinase [Candidatus Pacearchaeota archaeon]